MIDLFGQKIPDKKPVPRDSTNADRQARFVAQRTELEEFSPCADPEGRAAAEITLADWGVRYCMQTGTYKGLLKRPPSTRIKEYAHRLQLSIENGGLLHIRFPRGAGKTTWIKIAILWGVSTGKIRYGVAVAASGPLSSKIIRDLWNTIENSDAYAADYPEVSSPVRALEGMFQRAAGQMYKGTRTQIKRTNDEINFPVIEGSAASGAVIIAKGAGCALRGLVDGSVRPDYVLLDDIQTRKIALSRELTRKLVDWVQQDIMGLGGDTMLSIGMASTPIAANDISEQFADADLHPEWETISFPMMISWPDREDLWQNYDEIYRTTRNSGEVDEATLYYRNNQAVMDAGGEVLDPGCYDEKRELSGLQHARNLLIRTNSREAYEAEYQLITRKPMQMLSVDPKELQKNVNGYGRGVLPTGTLECLAFVDVMANAGLHYAVVAFGPRQTAAIIDYGVYPGDGRRIAPANATERQIQQLLSDAEHELVSRLLATPYRREDGVLKCVHAVWIDHGWQSVVGVRICDLFRRKGFPNIYTCAGRSSLYYDSHGKNVVGTGFKVDFRESDGVRFAMQNSDHWKETAQRAFRGTPLQPGSVSLWGNNPDEHREFCEQAASEVLNDKAISHRGIEIYKWNLKPGMKNHFLDTLSGCFAMASWYRFWDNDDVFQRVNVSSIPTAVQMMRPPPPPQQRRRRSRPAAVAVS